MTKIKKIIICFVLYVTAGSSLSDRGLGSTWIGLTKEADTCPLESDDPQSKLYPVHEDCRVRGWQWMDGSTYQYPDWHNWFGKYEPKYNQLCAEAYYYGQATELLWGKMCHRTQYFICEKGTSE